MTNNRLYSKVGSTCIHNYFSDESQHEMCHSYEKNSIQDEKLSKFCEIKYDRGMQK